ncbi:MAG: VOC family protein, partial [Eubacterium sp.]
MIKKVDHLVITTENMDACLSFYEQIGFSWAKNGERYELFAGDFKINVHQKGKELTPKASHVQSGSVDFCLEITDDPERLKEDYMSRKIPIECGVVKRNGVRGSMRS